MIAGTMVMVVVVADRGDAASVGVIGMLAGGGFVVKGGPRGRRARRGGGVMAAFVGVAAAGLKSSAAWSCSCQTGGKGQ